VVRGAVLVFTPDNFDVPQRVRIFADEDANTRNTRATFTVTARGYSARAIITKPSSQGAQIVA
jgi:hypothetical protein